MEDAEKLFRFVVIAAPAATLAAIVLLFSLWPDIKNALDDRRRGRGR